MPVAKGHIAVRSAVKSIATDVMATIEVVRHGIKVGALR
jgi:hypothetical protein